MDYASLSTEALIAKRNKLRDSRDDILSELKEVQAELNDREAADVAKGIVSDASPITLDHIARIIQPGSTKNTPSVGSSKVS